MPTENLITPDLLRRVAWTPPEPLSAASVGEFLAELGARPWQIAQTSQLIADAFVQSAQSAQSVQGPHPGPENPS
jgi:ribonuclease D